MNPLKLPLAYLLIISVTVAVPVAGQQKRRGPDKTAVKTPAAPAPAPVTFDTLLAADAFKVYVEVRGAGQLIRSNAANDLLDPVLKLGGPPKDFIEYVNWLKGHADELMTSRLLVAAWPTLKEVPEVVVAIEMATADEAAKFESQLHGLLPRILPPVTPQSSPQPEKQAEKQAEQPASEKPKEAAAPVPGYYLQRANSLIVISPKPVQLKKLRPKGSKLLSEDANFRVAYNRFSSEPIFVFVNVNAIQKEQEEQQKKYEEERKKAEEAEKALPEQQKAEAEKEGEGEAGSEAEVTEAEVMEPPVPAEATAELVAKEPSEAKILSTALSSLLGGLMAGGVPDLPDAVGAGFSPENDSFDVRVLLIDAPGETSDPIPIFTALALGDPISPESPKVLPADSELVVTMSLDLETIHAQLGFIEGTDSFTTTTYVQSAGEQPVADAPPELASPLRTIEKLLKINTKDDLLPLLGSEISVSLPVKDFSPFAPPRSYPQPQQKDSDGSKPAPRSPFVVISLRDKEGMRLMMPRLLEGFAGKAATALAQTERREDTELVSYANMFAYAFVGNFLVLSGDAATIRHVVESYLKGETLSADSHFKLYTRWQPQQLQGQVYVSPALTETYRTWANNPAAQISDEARGFLTRLSTAAQPVTYSLSNDGLGVLHELHVPKNFLVLTVASMASTGNPPETVKNERSAMSSLWAIANAQRNYKEQNGSRYASLEELVAAELVSEETVKAAGYKFDMTLTAEGFEVSAVPVEYGKTGKLSLFIDQSGIIRGGDHGGAAASASDSPIGQ
jgi:hypothetical protein